jgi:hypothetical protein
MRAQIPAWPGTRGLVDIPVPVASIKNHRYALAGHLPENAPVYHPVDQ